MENGYFSKKVKAVRKECIEKDFGKQGRKKSYPKVSFGRCIFILEM